MAITNQRSQFTGREKIGESDGITLLFGDLAKRMPEEHAKRVATTLWKLAQAHDNDLTEGRFPKAQAPPPPPPVPSGARAIFKKAGIFGINAEQFPSPSVMHNCSLSYLLVGPLFHGFNGDGTINLNEEDLRNRRWLDNGGHRPYREAGTKVLGWYWCEVRPESEAWEAAELAKRYALDGLVPNGEITWKADDPHGDISRAERHCAALEVYLRDRGIDPRSLAIALSTYGGAPDPWTLPIDYGAFLRREWPVLPQSYPGWAPEYAPLSCAAHSKRVGIPADMSHLTIGKDQRDPNPSYTVDRFVEELVAVKNRYAGVGLSLWNESAWSESELRQLGEAIRTKGIAVA